MLRHLQNTPLVHIYILSSDFLGTVHYLRVHDEKLVQSGRHCSFDRHNTVRTVTIEGGLNPRKQNVFMSEL